MVPGDDESRRGCYFCGHFFPHSVIMFSCQSPAAVFISQTHCRHVRVPVQQRRSPRRSRRRRRPIRSVSRPSCTMAMFGQGSDPRAPMGPAPGVVYREFCRCDIMAPRLARCLPVFGRLACLICWNFTCVFTWCGFTLQHYQPTPPRPCGSPLPQRPPLPIWPPPWPITSAVRWRNFTAFQWITRRPSGPTLFAVLGLHCSNIFQGVHSRRRR